MRLIRFVLLAFSLIGGAAFAAEPVVHPKADARRLEVLFLGSPTASHAAHDPITRYRMLKKATGTSGINLTYSESLEEALTPAFLAQFDAVLLYANWPRIEPAQERALISYIESGRGFIPVHSASACFGNSDAFIALVGARFQRHGGEVFTPATVLPDHPTMQGLAPLEAWDETYLHDRQGGDRTVLQVRKHPAGEEPWTWVRTQGSGRVFYTASGHDERVWDLPAFHQLLIKGITWAAGPEASGRLTRLQLPVLKEQDVIMPGYLRKQPITKAQMPLSPAESAKMIQVPLGFEVSLFAAEPEIVNPIYIGWDHRGRAYVIETIDYPNNLQAGNVGHDRIKIAEDTNGDGRADKFTVFAEGLSIPTSLVFVNGGVLTTNGTQLLFLKDTDGDDKADVRQVLVEGFKMHDTHASVSNLRYGYDNWIYATIGYSGFAGEVGGAKLEFAQGLFRFTPDGKKMEYLQPTTNNTWGLGFMEDFAILGSTANGNPSWVYTLPQERYRAFGINQPRTPRADDNPFYYPSSMDIRQVDVHGKYTAGAGHAFYTARRFPADYQNKVAFVTEPTGKLVGSFDVAPAGTIYTARQRPNNIFNSADAWSSPVTADVGPDGALWIADWYNLIIQHNPTPTAASSGVDAQNGRGNAYQTALRDTEHGRIWRVYPKGSANDAIPALDPARPETLVAGLSHTNQLWRLHAQRLLVEGGHRSAAADLRRTVQAGGVGAVHALQALAGLGTVDAELLTVAWRSDDAGLRRAGRELAARDNPAFLRQQVMTGTGPLTAANPRELIELLGAVSRLEASPELGLRIFATGVAQEAALVKDTVLADAWQLAARAHAAGVIDAALAANLPFKQADQSLAGQVLPVVAWYAGTAPDRRAAVLASARGQSNAFAAYVAGGLAVQATGPVAAKFAPDPVIHQRGAQIYGNTCVACHGLDAKGVEGAFPPLAGSEWITGDPSAAIRIVLHGLTGPITVAGQSYDSIMPPVVGLSDGDIASVLTYIRQSYGNDAAPVTDAEVRAVRGATRQRRDLWTAEELKTPVKLTP
ncbi:MAG TPA: PVC-type heme-binding CxxCH protein [Opitutaceae bacterium]